MPIKLLLYTHNGLGLGHLRRLLKIATFLQAEVGDLSILLLTESPLVHAFGLPLGTDVVKFPGVLKTDQSAISKALPLPFGEVVELRKRIIAATALSYQPHFFLADYSPLGMGLELLPMLRALKEAPNKTVLVCGLLDIYAPSYVRNRPQSDNCMALLDELYDEIWVYGCQDIYDPINEYRLPDKVARKVRFCGYLGIEPPIRSPEAIRQEIGIECGKLILVTVGGLGWDGFPVFDAYLNALECLPNDLEIHTLLVTGSQLQREQREILLQRCRQLGSGLPCPRSVQILEFTPKLLDYMAASDLIVARGGYNTVTEILSLKKQAVIIPRIAPNLEQHLRGSLLEKRGLIRMLHPARLTPKALSESLLAALHAPPLSKDRLEAVGFDLNGLHQIKEHVVRLLGARGPLRHPSR